MHRETVLLAAKAVQSAVRGASPWLEAMPPLLRKAVLMYGYAGLTALWAVAVVRRLRPGVARLAAALPIMVGNLLIPLLLDPLSEPLLITPLAGVFSLAAFKLLAFAIGRGPLVPGWLTPLQFGGVFLLPIVPIQVFTVGSSDTAHTHTAKQGRTLLLHCWANTGTAMMVSWVLALPYLPVMVRHWLYTLASATFLTGVFDMLGAVAYLGLKITAAPTFDRPWLCDSFQDFWARRWNLTTTYLMRVLVYEPVIEGRLLPRGSGVGRQPSAAEAAASPLVVCSSGGGRQPLEALERRAGSAEAAGGAAGGAGAGADAQAVGVSAEERRDATYLSPAGAPDAAARGTAAAAAAGPTTEALGDEGGSTGLRQRRQQQQQQQTAVHPSTAHGDGGVAASGRAGGRVAEADEAGTGARGRGGGTGGGAPRAPVSKLRKFLALQAVFLFSGLWHILIFWYNTRVFSWRWCAFFAVQAPILTAERLLRQMGKRVGIRLPRFLQVLLANFLLIAVARPLFFGPTDTTGFAARNLAVGQAPLWAAAQLARAVASRVSPHREV